MNMEERIARINELYHKSKEQGLTAEEKEEQARLRREYVDSIKRNLKSQLDNIVIERPDGSMVDLGQKYGGKTGKQKAENGGNVSELEDGQKAEEAGEVPEPEDDQKVEDSREVPEPEDGQKAEEAGEVLEPEDGQKAATGNEVPGTGGEHE